MEKTIEFAELNPVDQFLMNGCAFIPENVEGQGDCLAILLLNGERSIIHKSASSFLREVVRSFGNDLAKLRQIYSRATGRKYHIPLPLTNLLTLVPLKTRVAIGKQTVFGWFVAEKIRDLIPLDHGRTEVQLGHAHAVPVLWSLETCEDQYRKAVLAKDTWKRLHQLQPHGRRVDNLFHLYTPSDHTERLL